MPPLSHAGAAQPRVPPRGSTLVPFLWAFIVFLFAIASLLNGLLVFLVLGLAFIPTALMFYWYRMSSSAEVHELGHLALHLVYWLGFYTFFIPLIFELLFAWPVNEEIAREVEKTGRIPSFLIMKFLLMAVAPGVIEELYKWWLTSAAISIRKRYNERVLSFNQTVLFGVFGSLGFATMEDLLYVLAVLPSGTANALVVIVLRVLFFPIHVALGAASAKAIACHQADGHNPWYLSLSGIWRQVVVHGLYDFLLTIAVAPLIVEISNYFLLLLVVPLSIAIGCGVYLWRVLRRINESATSQAMLGSEENV